MSSKETCLLIATPNPLNGVGGKPKNKELFGVAKDWLVTNSKHYILAIALFMRSLFMMMIILIIMIVIMMIIKIIMIMIKMIIKST
jgi:hypothetical protein